MFFRQILHDERSCASYLIGCTTYGVCAVVDPQGEPQHYIDLVEAHGMAVQAVIETHIHADHRSCAQELASLSGAPLHIGPAAEVGYAYSPLSDQQIIQIGNRRIKVLHTPGHTPEHVCLFVDNWFVLTGDTLFVGDVGRVDLALKVISETELNALANQLYHSLQRLLMLPEWIEVYPGHYAGSVCGRGMDGKAISTIGRERLTNSALKLTSEAFIAFQKENLPPLPDDFERIKERNMARQEEKE